MKALTTILAVILLLTCVGVAFGADVGLYADVGIHIDQEEVIHFTLIKGAYKFFKLPVITLLKLDRILQIKGVCIGAQHHVDACYQFLNIRIVGAAKHQ